VAPELFLAHEKLVSLTHGELIFLATVYGALYGEGSARARLLLGEASRGRCKSHAVPKTAGSLARGDRRNPEDGVETISD